MKKRIAILIFSLFTLFFTLFFTLTAYADNKIENTIEDTAKYIYNNIQNPTISSIGGEWAIIGLARSNIDVPEEYYSKYYKNVEEYIKSKDGVLSEKKYTEYSRLVLALTSIGKNPADVFGYDVTMPLGDFEKTISQGINGAVYALIALDSGKYEIHACKCVDIKATREMYIDYILEKQKSDGGWAFTDNADTSDIDITAMVLQALSKYQNNVNVKNASDKAIEFLSKIQNENAGYTSWGEENSESCSQVIVALCELGVSPYDKRFVKNGRTLVDNLMDFYIVGQGFKHTINDEKTNQMSTEQAFYSLVAINRFENGQNTLYQMSDSISIDDSNIGLPLKNKDVNISEVSNDFVPFNDIEGHINKNAIEMLAKRKIINGKETGIFDPDGTMTRAEFATIIVRGLSLPIKENDIFIDVKKEDWFYEFVNTAYAYGIVNGVSDNEFNPYGTITKEEVAVMIARASKLCGMDTEISSQETQDILAGFVDYKKVSDWAKDNFAFLYKNSILNNKEIEIQPKSVATRADVAQILANMLIKANLIQE